MGAALIAWITAGMAALRASSSLTGVHIADSTSMAFDDVAGADLVILGDDRDDQGLTAILNGAWHDTGANAVQRGEADVTFTIVSQSGAALEAPARLAALNTLLTAVVAALVPSPSGSNLGVATVLGAVPTEVTFNQVMTASGVRVATATLTIRVQILA